MSADTPSQTKAEIEQKLMLLDRAMVSTDDSYPIQYHLPLDDLIEFIQSIVQAAEVRAKITNARDYWLYCHDILRDKPTKSIGIQEAIDVASEAYQLHTGESIDKMFADTAKQAEVSL